MPIAHVMGLPGRHAKPRAAFVLASGADDVVGAHRSTRARPLTRREMIALVVVGGSFLAVAGAIVALLPSGRSPGLVIVASYVLAYALVSRVEFEVFTGSSVPTQLVFVPMLFVLPLNVVPLAVALALALGSGLDWRRGSSLSRAGLGLIGSWHAVGPVLVLALVGDGTLGWYLWPVYIAALAAQFACEIAAVSLSERLARGTSPRTLLPHLARTQLVDAALAPMALALAFACQVQPAVLLLSLPLVALLRVFASERRQRIDMALELSSAYRGTAFLLGDVVEADDAYTGRHSRHVVELSVAVADELGVPSAERRDTEFVALLHDVGKVRIPAEIINKPGKLTPEERAVIETHTIAGEEMLTQIGGLLGSIGNTVRSCHERWDGRGYPDGLSAERIPRVARVVMCCDAFSAMTTDRPYRQALPLERAVDELRANAGTQFDPRVVGALIAVLERGGAVRSAGAAVEPPIAA
jgi:HD-GYP domain-containing protein (c-di-GMP phosphodiesterase class II)